MSETWVFNTKDSDACIDFAARGISEGWLTSVYRVPDEEKRAIRADARLTKEMMQELFDQDAEPLTDEEVLAYGFRVTEEGWVPLTSRRKAKLDDAEWHRIWGYFTHEHAGCILWDEEEWD